MSRATSVMRTLTRRLSLLGWNLAVHTVRIAHTLISLAGAAIVSWGASMIYTPAGWIVGGGFVLWLGSELSAAAAARQQGQ